MSWNHELLTEINQYDDLKIAPFHPDMLTTGTPTWIWEVVVDNRLFVRAYSGTSSRWYQAALAQRAGKIVACGKEFNVMFAVVAEPLLNDQIDQAYRKKYASSTYVSAMVCPRVRQATIEIIPA